MIKKTCGMTIWNKREKKHVYYQLAHTDGNRLTTSSKNIHTHTNARRVFNTSKKKE
jgi:hypothetical protein